MAAYTQCLRCAGAPRRPAGGSGLSLSIPSWHAALSDPGEFGHRMSRTSMPTSPSPRSEQLGTPNPPAIRFTRGTSFGASRFTHLLRPVRLLALLYGSDRCARPPRAFTSRLPTDRSPSPLLGITTTATGLLCWRDLHPLEWQLASLHQNRTCGFPAYGSHLGCVTAKRVLGQGWRMIGFGSQAFASFVIFAHVIRSFWLRRLSVCRQRSVTWCLNTTSARPLVGTAW